MLEFASLCGLPEKELLNARDNHPGYKYKPDGKVDFEIVQDQQEIEIGKYHFICTLTPGHTDGHMCLYEPEHKLLIAGDHILEEITPNISQWTINNPLSNYLSSLEKIKQLEVKLVLPGHRRIFKQCKRRIQELLKHHQNRLQEVLQLLALQPSNAFDLASRMTWDMSYETWEEFPIAQKWFATGEAQAHLTHLEAQGLLQKQLIQKHYVYSLSNPIS
jgi:glyoxylase-like metal-dependent hydrolase (beta-lactamase superfamily II)